MAVYAGWYYGTASGLDSTKSNVVGFTLTSFFQIIRYFLDRRISKKLCCNVGIWSTMSAIAITSHKNEEGEISMSILSFAKHFFLLSHQNSPHSWFNFRHPHCTQTVGALRRWENSLAVLVNMYEICSAYLQLNSNWQLSILFFVCIYIHI